MGTNCVAGSAEDAKWVQIVPSEDPEYYLFITDFGRNYLNEDPTQKLFVLHEDPMQNKTNAKQNKTKQMQNKTSNAKHKFQGNE